ncbi:NRDE family protein [Ferruginibacter paludis]|uniref:NRDE family protein n=1 Tax=Ferruginibacter paludis TaxID=1310417 RepID=UPI0025B58C99|nr:NRDE family protein [Ferruginibacter paludis]MDN3654844.1 NRDE family protein [Ferruginibacter paludis]
MCTVVFIPKGDKYFFASLRDESPSRPKAVVPDIYKEGNAVILSPIDAMAGGTWLGVTESGSVIILLNGGFEKHERKTNYRKSRGLIVAELLASNLPVGNWNLMDMQDVEPFTLVVWNEGNLFQLVWDGEHKHGTLLKSGQPYIWSSSTLYDQQARMHRSELFRQWIGINTPVSSLSVFNFFKSYTESENGFLMNRNEQTKTLSYTFIELQTDDSARMQYHDFLNDSFHDKKIWFNNGTKNLRPSK